jgi:hypothetical protein
MASESSWVLERFGSRGARLALIVVGVLFIALICGWAAVSVAAAWRIGHHLKGLADAAIALLLVLLSLRTMTVNWRATRAQEVQPAVLPDGNEQSGIWGVGGPSMREPGSTGVFLSRRSTDRR